MDITNLQLIAWIGFFCMGVASGIAAGVFVEKFRNKLLYAVAVVAVFFIAGAVLVALSYPTIVLVEIPDLTGLSKDQAELRLKEKGLIVTSTEQYHDTEEIRRVISQDLSPRLPVRKGTEIHFIVSKGPKPTPTPPSIIDPMNDTWEWTTHREDNKSSINITSIGGRTGNAIKISYDLKENGSVSIYKEIKPEILSEKEGILFFYKAGGGPNTLTIGLEYEDTTQFIRSGIATVTDNWVPVKVSSFQFKRWYDEEYEAYEGKVVDFEKVCKILFIIENRPEQGDVYGSGWVIIDDVLATTS